uniref:Uncharacterized protein n=1 Tax=Rhipicephalus zambeziensis TaxID=60191 RepID=A0A224YFZ1_9ACAR
MTSPAYSHPSLYTHSFYTAIVFEFVLRVYRQEHGKHLCMDTTNAVCGVLCLHALSLYLPTSSALSMKGCIMWKANTIARLHNINEIAPYKFSQVVILVHPCIQLICSLLSCCGGPVVTVLSCRPERCGFDRGPDNHVLMPEACPLCNFSAC